MQLNWKTFQNASKLDMINKRNKENCIIDWINHVFDRPIFIDSFREGLHASQELEKYKTATVKYEKYPKLEILFIFLETLCF